MPVSPPSKDEDGRPLAGGGKGVGQPQEAAAPAAAFMAAVTCAEAGEEDAAREYARAFGQAFEAAPGAWRAELDRFASTFAPPQLPVRRPGSPGGPPLIVLRGQSYRRHADVDPAERCEHDDGAGADVPPYALPDVKQARLRHWPIPTLLGACDLEASVFAWGKEFDRLGLLQGAFADAFHSARGRFQCATTIEGVC